MTTPAHLAALQWIHNQGEYRSNVFGIPFTDSMQRLMIKDGHLHWRVQPGSIYCYSLTDAGRRALHEVGK